MKRYLIFSGSGHVFLVTAWLVFGPLLSRPRMSYYSIDMVSSMPAGGPAGGGPAAEAVPVEEAPKLPRSPLIPEQRKLPAKDVIKVIGKSKKAQPLPPPKVQKKRGLNLKAALAVLDGQGGKAAGRPGPASSGGGGVGGAGGAGIAVEG